MPVNAAVRKLTDMTYPVPPHLSGGAGHSPAQAYDTVIPELPEIADLAARRSALDKIVQESQAESTTLANLVMSVDPKHLAKEVERVAVAFSTQTLLGQQAATAYQQMTSQKMALANSPESWSWQRQQLSSRVDESVAELVKAAEVLGETLLSTETNEPNNVSVEVTGRANRAIRELVSLCRKVPTDGQTVMDPAIRVAIYALPEEELPILDLIEPSEEATMAHDTVVVAKRLAKRAPGALIAALALGKLGGLSLDVASDWSEVERRAAMLAGAGKPDGMVNERVHISMGAGGGDTVGGGGGDLPSL